MEKFSYLKSSNSSYIDELFALYTADPTSVDPSWRYFFEGLELGEAAQKSTASEPLQGALRTEPRSTSIVDFSLESKVAELIIAYRELGRLLADINPLSPPPTTHPLLELSRFGLKSSNLDQTYSAGHLIGMGPSQLKDIIAKLRDIYCGSIGVEFTHIQNLEERNWLQHRMETSLNRESISPSNRNKILKRITESESFERFLHTRYVAQKRFSIEGAESLIPTLDRIIEQGALLGAQEFVLGMAHRGRLNVLAHIFGKSPEYIFTEFEGSYKVDTSLGEGDVKYHMGFSVDYATAEGKKIHLSLASNPSHLEFINPVIQGIAKAKQTQLDDIDRKKVIPLSIHGDAAFAGQGVCYETLNLSGLSGYKTGGTIHIVINNQVGFTTSPEDSRSTTYSTDVAKMLEVPIFHVNGDDPEALWYLAGLCVEYRQKFKKDIFIDLVCYRKYGHNEGDEPAFTQPLLYKTIKDHPSTREIYANQLVREKTLSSVEVEGMAQETTQRLIEAQARAKAQPAQPYISVFENKWKGLRRATDEDLLASVKTAVPEKKLKELAQKLNQFPEGFHPHPKLSRFYESRLKSISDGKNIDWGNGEVLAFASLLDEGYPVRLSGQDAQRGTFSHRHSVLHDFENGKTYTPLNHIGSHQASFDGYNSQLSETAVLGFEYGYSLADPNTLVIWEAQFGDFANGAQVIIDQFITSSESKWQRMSGITLLLPHGFEGQGPEHSSARLERFLQLCGKNNLIVCNFTTPAQIFHAFRRQVKRTFRKPMIVMSPKSLLRHPMAVSELKEFTEGCLEEVMDDRSISTPSQALTIQKVLLCSGKVYYDLLAARNAQQKKEIAIVRVEQLYPWPTDSLVTLLNRYKNAKIVWVQEEPKNMGAWSFVFNTWSGGSDSISEKVGNRSIEYVGREIGAAPAVGSHKVHATEQEALVQKALL